MQRQETRSGATHQVDGCRFESCHAGEETHVCAAIALLNFIASSRGRSELTMEDFLRVFRPFDEVANCPNAPDILEAVKNI